MTPRQSVHLVVQSVARAPRAFALSVFGIAVGISVLAFFLALSQGMQRRVLGRIFPADRLEVVPAKSSLDQSALEEWRQRSPLARRRSIDSAPKRRVTSAANTIAASGSVRVVWVARHVAATATRKRPGKPIAPARTRSRGTGSARPSRKSAPARIRSPR